MAKHQERVIVDVRNIFPSPDNSLAYEQKAIHRTVAETKYSAARNDTSSNIHESPAPTIEQNTNSNFIFGSGRTGSQERDLGFNHQPRNNKDVNETAGRFVVSGQEGAHRDNYTDLEDTSFDVTAFMTSYLSGGSNKRNPLFDVDNEGSSNSLAANSEYNTSYLSRGNNFSHLDTGKLNQTAATLTQPKTYNNYTGGLAPLKMDVPRARNGGLDDSVTAQNHYNETLHNLDNDDAVMEEEVTMEFWEEEAEDKVPKLYTEYVGEDFSQYFEDDVTNNDSNAKDKNGDNKKKTAHGTNLLELSTSTVSLNSLSSVMSEKKTPGGLKKFARVFQFNSLNGKNNSNGACGQNSIHNFSYSNSKIGTSRGQNNSKQRPAQYFNKTGSEIDSDSCRYPNQVGDSNNDNREISRTAEGNSDVILRSRQPSSSTSSSGGSMHSCSLLNGDDDRNVDDFFRDGNFIEPDFESKRKRNLYDSKGKKESSKKQNGFFKIRLHRRNSPGIDDDVMDVVKNTVFNPLSDSSDVYL